MNNKNTNTVITQESLIVSHKSTDGTRWNVT